MGTAATAAALGLGIGVGYARDATIWSRDGAILDADFVAGRFVFGGQGYSSKAALLAALGGSESSGTISIGPYVATDATELLVNSDFSGGLTGWTPTQLSGGPSTGAVAAGEYTLTGNGANCPCVTQGVAVAAGHAYLARGKYRRGSALSPTMLVTAAANGSSALAIGPANTTTSYIDVVRTFATVGALPTIYVGMRMTVNPANGSGVLDDFSMRECSPFRGFVPGAVSGLVEATTPPSASGDKVLWQLDDDARDFDNSARQFSYIRLYWDAIRHLHLLVSYQASASSTTTQADLDLGVVDVSTGLRVSFSCAPNSFIASLDGQPALSDTSGTFPGAAVMRLGCSAATSNNWDGSIGRVTIWAATKLGEELEQLSAADPVRLYAAWGDSLTASSGSSGAAARYPAVASVAYNPDRPVSNRGVGGQTSTQIAARQGGLPITVTVSADTIPASGSVAVTAKNINVLYASGTFTGSLSGTIAGVAGTMGTDASGNWTFTRTLAGTAVVCPPGTRFIPELAVLLRPRTQWLWLGRNGAQAGHTVESDIAAAVAWVAHARYLVGSILTGADDGAGGVSSIEARNATLAAIYGDRYVDVLRALKDANNGSADDLADIAAGITPRSLRSDAIHLNDAGYAVVAAAFKAANDAMGW